MKDTKDTKEIKMTINMTNSDSLFFDTLIKPESEYYSFDPSVETSTSFIKRHINDDNLFNSLKSTGDLSRLEANYENFKNGDKNGLKLFKSAIVPFKNHLYIRKDIAMFKDPKRNIGEHYIESILPPKDIAIAIDKLILEAAEGTKIKPSVLMSESDVQKRKTIIRKDRTKLRNMNHFINV